MEQFGLSIQSQDLDSSSEFLIFTHSIRTRFLVLASFCMYLVIFFLLMSSLKNQVQNLEDIPQALKGLSDNQSLILTYCLMGLSFLIAAMILVYLFWAVVDVWGLQVHLSSQMIQVRNTVTGNHLVRVMGVGEIRFKELEEVEGGFFSTRLVGSSGIVRFSPVERIEVLIARIMEYAPKANFNVR